MLNPKTKERELAYIVTIDDILPIEGADRVEVAIVGGWRIMVRKGQFKSGDFAVYFEIDSKVPAEEPFLFLAGKHFKIKTQKYFKGAVLSQGLLMSFTDFKDEQGRPPSWMFAFNLFVAQGGDWENDACRFLTKELGVTYASEEDNKRKASSGDKYKKMAGRHPKLFRNPFIKWLYKKNWGKKLLFIFFGKAKDKKNGWPVWVAKTDEERIENLPHYLADKCEWIATEKVDGSSSTFTIKRKKGFKKNEFFVCSRNVCFDSPDKPCYYDTNIYFEIAYKYNMENILTKLLEEFPNANWITIQGEIYGAGVQKRNYSMTERDFKAFNLIIDGKGRLNSIEMTKILSKYNLPCVDILNECYILPDTIEELRNYVNSEGSRIDGEIKEGIVFRSLDGIRSFKCVSPEFLLKYH